MGLKRPANECRKSAAAVLLLANAPQMLDSIFDRLHVAEHHGCAGFQSQFVRHLHYLQPFVAVDFQRRNSLPHAVHQNFTAAAWDRTKSSVFEFGNHFPQRHPESFREMLKLGRTESVDIDVRIFVSDVMEEIDIPLERQLRMMPAL